MSKYVCGVLLTGLLGILISGGRLTLRTDEVKQTPDIVIRSAPATLSVATQAQMTQPLQKTQLMAPAIETTMTSWSEIERRRALEAAEIRQNQERKRREQQTAVVQLIPSVQEEIEETPQADLQEIQPAEIQVLIAETDDSSEEVEETPIPELVSWDTD